MTTSTKPIWTISVNGQIGDEYTSTVPVMDRGFLFGDSLYETMATHQGVLLYWEDHFKRLQNTAAGLSLRLTCTLESLFHEIKATVHASRPMGDVYVRTVISRGFSQDIGLYPETFHQLAPTRIIMVKPIPQIPEDIKTQGLCVMIPEKIKRNPRQSLDPNLKTGNYLNSILAMIEAKNGKFHDAIMLNAHGHVTEGTTYNIWGVKDGTLFTPAMESGILGGITRLHLLNLARMEKIPVQETLLSAEELMQMDEVFTSSSIRGVLPVHRINE